MLQQQLHHITMVASPAWKRMKDSRTKNSAYVPILPTIVLTVSLIIANDHHQCRHICALYRNKKIYNVNVIAEVMRLRRRQHFLILTIHFLMLEIHLLK